MSEFTIETVSKERLEPPYRDQEAFVEAVTKALAALPGATISPRHITEHVRADKYRGGIEYVYRWHFATD